MVVRCSGSSAGVTGNAPPSKIQVRCLSPSIPLELSAMASIPHHSGTLANSDILDTSKESPESGPSETSAEPKGCAIVRFPSAESTYNIKTDTFCLKEKRTN